MIHENKSSIQLRNEANEVMTAINKLMDKRTWKYKVGDPVYYRTGDDTEFAKIEQRRPCQYSNRNYYRLDTGAIREESTLKQATRFEELTDVLKASIVKENSSR